VYELETIPERPIKNYLPYIEQYLRYIYDKAELEDECLSLMLIYLIRLVVSSQLV
jgi:hypothetical protein